MILRLKRGLRYYLLTGKDRLRTLMIFLLFLVMAFGAIWWLIWGQYRETTEDAYVEGNIINLHTQQAGTVIGIYADTMDQVKKGELLIRLNPNDAKLGLEESASKLAQTVRDLRGLYAKRQELAELVKQHESEVLKATSEYNRRLTLYSSHAISQEELQHAKQQLDSAEAILNASQYELDATAAQVDHTTVKTHPSVLSAATDYRNHYLQLTRTEIFSPISGMVTKRVTQLGQHVNPGGNLLSIVDLDDLWVTANFKESQLQHLEVGQPVVMRTDLYGRSVKYHGKVVGVDVGTGSAFALLPAQNATGNWIKVVQRVPVRIALDPDEVARHPLRIGLSMRVTVDTTNRSANTINFNQTSIRKEGGYHLDQYEAILLDADRIIEKIIDENWIDRGE